MSRKVKNHMVFFGLAQGQGGGGLGLEGAPGSQTEGLRTLEPELLATPQAPRSEGSANFPLPPIGRF